MNLVFFLFVDTIPISSNNILWDVFSMFDRVVDRSISIPS